MVAYNSEGYIAETIKSIVNQTEKNIQLIIRNNGSTDNTDKICRKFMQKDERIIYLQNKVNLITDDGIPYPERGFWPQFAGEYVSMVDSDDLLAPQYAQEMYRIAKSSNADIVVAGTTMFEDQTKRIVTQRIPPALVTTDMSDIAQQFPDLYGSFRPVWGKLYRTAFFEQYYDFAWRKPQWLTNGMDTYTSLGYLMRCQKLVSLDKALHFYRIRQKSAFHAATIETKRIKAGEVLYQRGLECLEGLHIATTQNREYLAAVYWGHQLDLLQLLDRSTEMSVEAKLDFLEALVNEPLLITLTSSEANFAAVYGRIKESLDKMKADAAIDILSAKHFLSRLDYSRQQQEQPSPLSGLILLSAIADASNIGRFGWQLLKKSRDSLSTGAARLLRLSQSELMELLNDCQKLRSFILEAEAWPQAEQIENSLQQALEANATEQAIQAINDITAISPLNPMSLYFRICFAYVAGDIAFAQLMASTAHVFWPENEAIGQIYHDVWQIDEA